MIDSFETIAQILAEKALEEKVLIRNIHLDLNSIEKRTGLKNDKYKLLTNRIKDFGLYFFYVLTKTGDSCPKRAKIELFKEEYEFRNNKHLPLECSYVNLERPIIEERDSLIYKLRKSDNNFECVAQITQLKLNEIKDKAEEMRHNTYIDEKTKTAILISFGVEEISSDFVKNYGI
jgi:hypothetical protein